MCVYTYKYCMFCISSSITGPISTQLGTFITPHLSKSTVGVIDIPGTPDMGGVQAENLKSEEAAKISATFLLPFL